MPHLRDMVSEKPDPMKSTVLAYLKLHCIACSPGMVYDELDPQTPIGNGNIFSDGTYLWDDVFCNYVEKYNIPIPPEFREYILANHVARMKRHLLLRAVDCVEILNNPYLGYTYSALINKNGIVNYMSSENLNGEAILLIKQDYAKYIIDPIMTELFCYDADEHGKSVIDGYHWLIRFLKDNKEIDKVEGWNGEDPWRYHEAKSVFEFVERHICHELGTKYM